MRHALSLLSVLFLAGSAPAGDEKVFSGPQPGEKLTAFKAQGISGPEAGKEFMIAGGKPAPTLLIFVHEITRPGMQLLRPVDYYASRLAPTGLQTHLVWLSADRTKTEEFLTRAKQSLSLRSPVSISLDGQEGPGNYGLNRKVALTILVARDGKVTDNFAIIQPNETDAPKVLAALAKLTGQKAPTLDEIQLQLKGGGKRPIRPDQPGGTDPARALLDEVRQLQKQVNDLTDALNEARAKLAKLEGKPAPAPLPKRKPSTPERPKARGEGKPSADPQLQGLMRRMIQKDNDEAAVQRIADEMTRWAGEDRARRAQLTDYCRLVVRLGYGTEAAQKALKKLAGD